MDKLEQKLINEISKLDVQIKSADKMGHTGLKNEYIAARSAYNHALVMCKYIDKY